MKLNFKNKLNLFRWRRVKKRLLSRNWSSLSNSILRLVMNLSLLRRCIQNQAYNNSSTWSTPRCWPYTPLSGCWRRESVCSRQSPGLLPSCYCNHRSRCCIVWVGISEVVFKQGSGTCHCCQEIGTSRELRRDLLQGDR